MECINTAAGESETSVQATAVYIGVYYMGHTTKSESYKKAQYTHVPIDKNDMKRVTEVRTKIMGNQHLTGRCHVTLIPPFSHMISTFVQQK